MNENISHQMTWAALHIHFISCISHFGSQPLTQLEILGETSENMKHNWEVSSELWKKNILWAIKFALGGAHMEN